VAAGAAAGATPAVSLGLAARLFGAAWIRVSVAAQGRVSFIEKPEYPVKTILPFNAMTSRNKIFTNFAFIVISLASGIMPENFNIIFVLLVTSNAIGVIWCGTPYLDGYVYLDQSRLDEP
jgi:hypothetical protein